MIKTYRKVRALVAAAFGLLLALSALFLCMGNAGAYAEEERGWYYNQLSLDAMRFYRAIGDMEEQGLLKKGNAEYDLVANGTLTEAQLKSYSASTDVLVAFGAARDAYSLDHPDVFYADLSYLSVSVGTKDGKYVASLGTGRSESYYLQEAGGFQSEEEVDRALSEYESALAQIVSGAREKETAVDRIVYVNEKILEGTEYDFCSTADANGTVYTPDAPFIRTAYGALVRGKSVCEGYARAFKAVMDELGIPCVLVQGYALSENGLEPHMWNYVEVDGGWYGVDVTWNDGENCPPDGYLLLGNADMKREHFPDGVVSQSNYEFRYPALNPYRYGVTQDEGGLTVEGVYSEYQNGEGETVANLTLHVSYNGKNSARILEEDGLYLACRMGAWTNGALEWYDWCYLEHGMYGYDEEGYYRFTGANTYVEYVQFALIDYAPDNPLNVYDGAKLTSRHIRNVSEPFGNATYGSYVAPPSVKELTPSNSAMLEVTQKYDVTAVYSEELVLAGDGLQAGIRVGSQHDGVEKYVDITNFEWSGDKISFTFRPSQMFEHNNEVYSFYPVNLVGKKSGKSPNPVTYSAMREYYVCDKVYGDGRLYMTVYGQPSLIGTEDLSLKGWTDANGNHLAENQRSQLMLVTSRPAQKQSDDMLGSAAENAGVEAGDILASETYELDLQICGMIQRIPAGSYMQLSFGFPEGYGPNDAGVTFKVYHFRRDANGDIDPEQTQELDCVVTPYGLVVTVTDFSPFAVVVLPEEESAEKAVYARTAGVGGTLEGSGIAKVKEGESAVYAFRPDEGYAVDFVTLNGKEVAVKDNALTIAYNDLAKNNVLEVSFASERVLSREAEEGVTVVRPSAQAVDPMGTFTVSLSADKTQVEKGGALTLTAAALSRGALVGGRYSYRWYKDGALIAGETGETLTLANFSSDDEGSYSVTAVRTYGERTQTAQSEAVNVALTGGFNLALVLGVSIAVFAVLGAGVAVAIVFVVRRDKNAK